jgi:hypothetical protein
MLPPQAATVVHAPPLPPEPPPWPDAPPEPGEPPPLEQPANRQNVIKAKAT